LLGPQHNGDAMEHKRKSSAERQAAVSSALARDTLERRAAPTTSASIEREAARIAAFLYVQGDEDDRKLTERALQALYERAAKRAFRGRT
jgi:hypothetical protein